MDWILNSIMIFVVVMTVNIVLRVLFRRITRRSKWLRKHEHVSITQDQRFPTIEWVSWPKETFYGPLIILLAIFSFILTPILVYNLISGDINSIESVFSWILFILIFVIPAWIMLRSACTRFRISPEGIERHVAWFKGKSYRWDEILGIWYNEDILRQSLMVKTTKGRFWISMGMLGASTFATAVVEKVPKDRWKKAASVLLRSADSPQLIPSKEERKRLRKEYEK